jgi:hypothetical protein
MSQTNGSTPERRRQRLQVAKINTGPISDLPALVPRLVARWRRLVERYGDLATNPSASLSEIETAREHLKALLGTLELRARDGVLWAYPALNAKGLAEASPLHINVVAGASCQRYLALVTALDVAT